MKAFDDGYLASSHGRAVPRTLGDDETSGKEAHVAR